MELQRLVDVELESAFGNEITCDCGLNFFGESFLFIYSYNFSYSIFKAFELGQRFE
jgi:hypothetical protein